MKFTLLISAMIVLFTVSGFGQYGGKAEANRIKFPRRTSTANLIGTLSNGEEMEFVFAARKGQRASIRNPSRALFDVRIFNTELGVETDFRDAASFTVDLPATGDYLLYVRKKAVGSHTGRFSVTLTIR